MGVFPGMQGMCGHEHSTWPSVPMGERASLPTSQKKPYSLLLWKLLPGLLVILNKQDGLNTKKGGFQCTLLNVSKLRQFCFVEGNLTWPPLRLSQALQLTMVWLTGEGIMVWLTGEGFWGSRQKASLVGLTTVTWTTDTSKEVGPFPETALTDR